MPATRPDVLLRFDDLVREILEAQPSGDKETDVHLPTPTFDKLLAELDLPPEVEAMLSRFFVIDHKRRPTAEELLQSEEYKALETAQLSKLRMPE